MEKEEILTGLLLELRRGTLVFCVLLSLKKPMYGYSLVGEMAKRGVSVETNTLYPLLRRLEGQGLLLSNWETSESKPRKYYQTTALGHEICVHLKKHWDESEDTIFALWKEFRNEA